MLWWGRTADYKQTSSVCNRSRPFLTKRNWGPIRHTAGLRDLAGSKGWPHGVAVASNQRSQSGTLPGGALLPWDLVKLLTRPAGSDSAIRQCCPDLFTHSGQAGSCRAFFKPPIAGTTACLGAVEGLISTPRYGFDRILAGYDMRDAD